MSLLMNVIFITSVIMVLFALSFMSYLFSGFEEKSNSSNHSFECGFDSLSSNLIPFTVHFYLMGVLFLVFDIEFLISLPLVFFDFEEMSLKFIFWMVYGVLMFTGLVMEVNLGSLDWKF